MPLSLANLLAMAYGISEMALSLTKRSGGGARSEDRGSLRRLWVVILVAIAVAFVAAGALPAAHSRVLLRLRPAGVGLFAGGLLLRWYAIVHLGRFFTVDVALAADHRVVDTGPYRFLRHPSYTGALAAFSGLGICMANWGSLLVLTGPITAVFLQRIRLEEAVLLQGLGEPYRVYCARTRRLIPFVY